MGTQLEEYNESRRGAFAGLACGDALGARYEGSKPGTPGLKAPADEIALADWTDDTSMALCLAESLLNRAGFDARDQMERYLRWLRFGRWSSRDTAFGVGDTVRRALERFERTGDPFSGSLDPQTAGNGSLMRLAPVPVWYASDLEAVFNYSGESSLTTHGTAEAVDACRYFGLLIAIAFVEKDKDKLLERAEQTFRDFASAFDPSPAILEIASGSYARRQPPEIRGTGYVVQSLEAALWAFHSTDSFSEGACAAVNLGEDTDTTAAVFGQLAGAFYGYSAIPRAWRQALARRAEIESLIAHLIAESPPKP